MTEIVFTPRSADVYTVENVDLPKLIRKVLSPYQNSVFDKIVLLGSGEPLPESFEPRETILAVSPDVKYRRFGLLPKDRKATSTFWVVWRQKIQSQLTNFIYREASRQTVATIYSLTRMQLRKNGIYDEIDELDTLAALFAEDQSVRWSNRRPVRGISRQKISSPLYKNRFAQPGDAADTELWDLVFEPDVLRRFYFRTFIEELLPRFFPALQARPEDYPPNKQLLVKYLAYYALFHKSPYNPSDLTPKPTPDVRGKKQLAEFNAVLPQIMKVLAPIYKAIQKIDLAYEAKAVDLWDIRWKGKKCTIDVPLLW